MISANMTWELATGGSWIPVPTVLTYHSENPYAISASFNVGLPQPVEWEFARELLRIEGSRYGIGDVGVCHDNPQVIRVTLRSPYGTADFRVSSDEVKRFLDRTYMLVPEGAEQIDMDHVIRQLFRTSK